MFEAFRRAGVFSRHLPAAALAVACLLVAALTLAACGPGVHASGPVAALGASTPAAAVTAAAEGWADAGQFTPTPGAAGGPAATGTPEPEATSAATGDSYQAVNFTGPVEVLPAAGWNGRWQVGGRAVNVSSTTVVTEQAGKIAQGAQVNVEGWQQPDGTVDAGWITVVGEAANSGNPSSGNPSSGNASSGNAGSGNAGSGMSAGSGNAASAASTTPAAPTPAVSAQPGTAGSDGESEDNHNDNEDNNDKNDQAAPNSAPGSERGAQPVELRGYVQALPPREFVGDWRVSGRTVHVNAHTRLNQKLGAFVDGAYVQLMGWQQPDGSINAAWVQVKKAPGGEENGNAGAGGGNGKGGNGKGNGNGNGNGKGKGKGGD